MFVVGLTGGFASGKTTVRKMFEQLGIKSIDADELARDCLTKDEACIRKVVELFGQDVVGEKQKLNRSKIAQIVFQDQSLRKDLENIVHPYVFKKIDQRIKSFENKKYVLIDMPLLFETNYDKKVQATIVVKADREKQIERAQKRTDLSREMVEKIIDSQMSLEEKIKKADFVIDNNGDLMQTEKQVKDVYQKLEIKKGELQ